jgi:dTMP kinase
MSKGCMIAVEGADKAGKHTQVMNIMSYLKSKNIPAETLDFPQYKAFFGKLIKDYLNGKFGGIQDLPAEYAMLPYALDRLQYQPLIKKWLDEEKWVILDRYTYSNSFSVAKCPQELWQEKINYMEDLEFNQMKLIKPNHNIYLYLDPKIAFGMRNQGLKEYQNGKADIHERDFDLLYNVSKVYHEIAKQNPNAWTVVDEMKADGTRMNPEEVFLQLKPIIDRWLLQKNR